MDASSGRSETSVNRLHRLVVKFGYLEFINLHMYYHIGKCVNIEICTHAQLCLNVCMHVYMSVIPAQRAGLEKLLKLRQFDPARPDPTRAELS